MPWRIQEDRRMHEERVAVRNEPVGNGLLRDGGERADAHRVQLIVHVLVVPQSGADTRICWNLSNSKVVCL